MKLGQDPEVCTLIDEGVSVHAALSALSKAVQSGDIGIARMLVGGLGAVATTAPPPSTVPIKMAAPVFIESGFLPTPGMNTCASNDVRGQHLNRLQKQLLVPRGQLSQHLGNAPLVAHHGKQHSQLEARLAGDCGPHGGRQERH